MRARGPLIPTAGCPDARIFRKKGTRRRRHDFTGTRQCRGTTRANDSQTTYRTSWNTRHAHNLYIIII